MKKRKILIIFILIILLLIAVFSFEKIYTFLDKEMRYREFEKIETLETIGNLNYIEEDNRAVVENMDFTYQDNIGIKVNYISITDDTLKANISFKIDEDFDCRTFGYSFAIYDENMNVYAISTRMHLGENLKYDYDLINMQRELGISKKKDIYDIYLNEGSGIENVTKNEEEKIISTTIKLDAKDRFPLSKKIYIKLWDLGYFNVNKDNDGKTIPQNVNLNNSKWQFEFDIPEGMNKRDTMNLKLDEEIPGLEIINMTITDTKLVIKFKSEEYLNLINAGKDMPGNEFSSKCKEMLNITDGNGTVLQEVSAGTRENNEFKISFDYNKKDFEKKLFINYKVGNKQYRSELIKI